MLETTNQISLQAPVSHSPSGTDLVIFDRPASYEQAACTRPLITYISYDAAFNYFNEDLLDSVLRPPLITLQNNVGAYGSFSVSSVVNMNDRGEIADKIILSQRYVAVFPVPVILSCLVRQMVGVWNFYHGTRSRPGYFPKSWFDKMKEIGLTPHAGGEVDRKHGEKLRHIIDANGAFDRVCMTFLRDNKVVLYQDRAYSQEPGDEGLVRTREKKSESKTRYSCLRTGLNAWAKPGVRLLCGCCETEMSAR